MRHPWVVYGYALVAFHVGIQICVQLVPTVDGNDWTGGILYGVWFGQVSLASIWGAFAPQSLRRRVAVAAALLLITTGGFLTYVGRFSGLEQLPFLLVIVGGATLMQTLAVQTPLWVARIGFGWRLDTSERAATAESKEDMQFGIKQLFLWTAAVAAALGIGWAITSQQLLEGIAGDLTTVSIFTMMISFNALIALPSLWAAFSREYVLVWSVLVSGYTMALSLVEMQAFQNLVRQGEPGFLFWLITNLIQVGLLLTSMLCLRLAGLRLMRGKPRGKAAGAAGPTRDKA